MTQKEKQLLLKDICARVPYRPFIELNPGSYNKPSVHRLTGVDELCEVYLNIDSEPYNIEHIKPYLRPMSSMTEEERKEYNEYLFHGASIGLMSNTETAYELIDWLLAHHFDFRCLISMGLAFEAPKDMYHNR